MLCVQWSVAGDGDFSLIALVHNCRLVGMADGWLGLSRRKLKFQNNPAQSIKNPDMKFETKLIPFDIPSSGSQREPVNFQLYLIRE